MSKIAKQRPRGSTNRTEHYIHLCQLNVYTNPSHQFNIESTSHSVTHLMTTPASAQLTWEFCQMSYRQGRWSLMPQDASLYPLLRNTMEMVQLNKMCVIRGKQVRDQKCVRRPIITQTIAANKPCELLYLQQNNMYIYN